MTAPIGCRYGCECSAHPRAVRPSFEHIIENLISKFGQKLDPAGVLEEEIYVFAVHVYQSGFADGLRPPPPPGKVRKGI